MFSADGWMMANLAGGALAAWIVNYRLTNAWFAVPVLLAITAASAGTIMAVDHFLLPHLLGISRSLQQIPAVWALLIATGHGTVASAILPGHVLYATPRNW
jgi:hypothetical protein